VETYTAMRLMIDNWRWAGVPFYLRTGKRLNKRSTEIAIRFKKAPLALFRETPVEALGESDTHHFFVIDQSYSMAYKRAQNTSLDVAKRAALKVLQDIRTSEQDRFSILPLSSYPEPILVNSNRKERLQTAINELRPSDFGTSVYATMQSLRNLLESPEIKNRDRRVYIFTDMQRNGWILRDEQEAKKFSELLKTMSKKDNTRFFIYDAGTSEAFNHAIVDLRANDDPSGKKGSTVEVTDSVTGRNTELGPTDQPCGPSTPDPTLVVSPPIFPLPSY